MRVIIVSPGQFTSGLNSPVRGEGRWLGSVGKVLSEAGHEVFILSTDPGRTYQESGLVFSSIHSPPQRECDLLVSMDAWSDVPHVHKTPWEAHIRRLAYKQRLLSLYFPTHEEVYSYIPTAHPWNYNIIRNGHGIFLPIVTHEYVTEPQFDRNHIHFFSKRPDENPEYLIGVLTAIYRLITECGATASFIDSAYLRSGKYRAGPAESQLISRLFDRICVTGRVIEIAHWANYDQIRRLLGKSKLLLGIHHPIAAPSMAEIAALGGAPVLFFNQAKCPPYDVIELPHIAENASSDDICDFIFELWQSESFFSSVVRRCQEAIEPHRKENARSIILREVN